MTRTKSDSVHPVARLPAEWGAALSELGERSFRSLEVFRWVHKKAELDPEQMTTLPKALRAKLFEGAASVGTIDSVHRSSYDTRKVLVRLADAAPIETVLIPRVSGPGSEGAAARAASEEDADVAAASDDEDD